VPTLVRFLITLSVTHSSISPLSSLSLVGFHHNCRHERFSRVIHPFEHHGTTYPLHSVIRTDEEYNRNEDRSSSDGPFDERNNLLVCSPLSLSLSLLLSLTVPQDAPNSSLSPISNTECTAEDFHRCTLSSLLPYPSSDTSFSLIHSPNHHIPSTPRSCPQQGW
jgi:hypothetical protein